MEGIMERYTYWIYRPSSRDSGTTSRPRRKSDASRSSSPVRAQAMPSTGTLTKSESSSQETTAESSRSSTTTKTTPTGRRLPSTPTTRAQSRTSSSPPPSPSPSHHVPHPLPRLIRRHPPDRRHASEQLQQGIHEDSRPRERRERL